MSKKLDTDMMMVMKDRDTDRIFMYCSGDKTKGHYTFEKAATELTAYKNKGGGGIRMFDDDDYVKLQRSPRDKTDEEEDDEHTPPMASPKMTQADRLKQAQE